MSKIKSTPVNLITLLINTQHFSFLTQKKTHKQPKNADNMQYTPKTPTTIKIITIKD